MEPKEYQKRQQARNLYLHTDKTQKEIADILDINSKTLYLWIKHNRWEEIKIAARQAPMCMVQDMYNHISAINNSIYSREDKCPTPKEVDMLKKLAGTAKILEAKQLSMYIEAFMELTAYINGIDRDLAVKIIPHADKYIKAKVNKLQSYSPYQDVRIAKENLKEQEDREEKALYKHKREEVRKIIIEDLKKNPIARNEPVPNEVGGASSRQPVPNAVGGVRPNASAGRANSHHTIEPLSNCVIQPSDKNRASSGMTSQKPISSEVNTVATSHKNEPNPMPEKTEKNHPHHHNHPFMKRAS